MYTEAGAWEMMGCVKGRGAAFSQNGSWLLFAVGAREMGASGPG